VLPLSVTIGYKLVLSPHPARYPHHLLALATNCVHSSLRVFRWLRTLSFFGSQLSLVLSTSCALLRKKAGVLPLVPPIPDALPGNSILPTGDAVRLPPLRWSLAPGDWHLFITPFATALTKKRGLGGAGHTTLNIQTRPPASEGGRYKSAGKSACSTQQALPQPPACPKCNRRVHALLPLPPSLLHSSFFRYNLGLALLPWGSEVTG